MSKIKNKNISEVSHRQFIKNSAIAMSAASVVTQSPFVIG